MGILENESEKILPPSQQEIGDKIGMNRSVIAGFARLSDSVVAKVMAKTKLHQKGRVTEDVANATHNFTEGWFRNSGLYDLTEDYQLSLTSERKLDNVRSIKSERTPKGRKRQSYKNS